MSEALPLSRTSPIESRTTGAQDSPDAERLVKQLRRRSTGSELCARYRTTAMANSGTRRKCLQGFTRNHVRLQNQLEGLLKVPRELSSLVSGPWVLVHAAC